MYWKQRQWLQLESPYMVQKASLGKIYTILTLMNIVNARQVSDELKFKELSVRKNGTKLFSKWFNTGLNQNWSPTCYHFNFVNFVNIILSRIGSSQLCFAPMKFIS